MGRPRKHPVEEVEEPEEQEHERKTRGKTKLTYDGPSGQVVQGLGALEAGEVYEIPDELAESLLASSRFWKEA